MIEKKRILKGKKTVVVLRIGAFEVPLYEFMFYLTLVALGAAGLVYGL